MNKKFEYNGFEAEIRVSENNSSNFVATLRKKYLEKLEVETYRSSEDELKVALQDQVDEYYREHRKYFPLDTKPTTKVYWVFGILAILWIVSVALFYWIGIRTEANLSSNSWSVFSSFFNNFSAPIVSLISFFALLWTIFQQQKAHNVSLEELRLTRVEVELTREEMSKTTKANEEQAEALQQQVEEAKKTTVAQLKFTNEQRRAAEAQQFETTFNALLEQHNKSLAVLVGLTVDDVYSETDTQRFDFKSQFDAIHRNAELCSYFRVLYQLLKFVAVNFGSNINDAHTLPKELFFTCVDNKEKFYTSLIRSFIPSDIVKLLAVNCYAPLGSSDGYYKYHQLIERYSLLEHYPFPASMYSKSYGLLGYYTYDALGDNYSITRAVSSLKRALSSDSFRESKTGDLRFGESFRGTYWANLVGFRTMSRSSVLCCILSEECPNLEYEQHICRDLKYEVN